MSTESVREQYTGMPYDELLDEATWIREFLDRMAAHCGTKDCPSLVAYVDRLEAENDKLRELCATVIDDWMSKVCPTFPFCGCGGEFESCTDETCGNQCYRQMARELGVEVNW